MNKVLHIVFLFLALLAFPSCEDGNEFDDKAMPSLKSYYLALSESEYEIESEVGSSASAQVSSLGTPWVFQGYTDWLHVSPVSGNKGTIVTFSAATANTSGDNMRTSIFQFASADPEYMLNSQVSVTQLAASPFIELSATTLDFKGFASVQQVTVSTNIAYTVQGGNEGWLTVVCSDDKTQLTVSVSKNLTGKPRNATIKLAGKVDVVIQVNQAVPVINEVETQQLHFPIGGATYELSFNAETEWTAVSTAGYWLSVSPDAGPAGQNKISVTALPNSSINEQSGSIQLLVGPAVGYTIPCIQDGFYLTVTPKRALLPSTGGTHSVHVSTNDSWTASTSSSWISLSSSSGTDDAYLTLTASDNPSSYSRKDTTTINPAYNKPIQVITSQSGRYLNVSESIVAFFKRGGTSKPVVVETDGTFDVSLVADASDWLSVQRSGKSFTLVATANETEAQRQTRVKIYLTGLNTGESYDIEIPVIQNYKEGISVIPFGSDQTWEINSGESTTITVTGFGSDNIWDEISGVGGNIGNSGFGSDNNWDN